MKKRYLSILLPLFLFLTFGVLGVLFFKNFKMKREPIKIGVVSPLTGDNAPYGIPVKRATTLFTEKINKEGGILGRQIELLIEDDLCVPEVAMDVVSRLIAQNVVAVVGHICSSTASAVLGLYKDQQIPIISPGATNPELTRDNDVFFRTVSPDDAQALKAASYVLDTLQPKKIAIFHDRDTYGQGYAELFRDFIERDGRIEVVIFMGINPESIDFSFPVDKISESGAEFVLWGGYMEAASRLLGQLIKKNIEVIFMSGDSIKSDKFIEMVGEKAAEGVYATAPVDTSQYPMAVTLTREYGKNFDDDPGVFFQEAYAAIMALVNAIEKAEATDFFDVRYFLINSKIETPLGLIGFDANGEIVGSGYSVYRIENGRFIDQT